MLMLRLRLRFGFRCGFELELGLRLRLRVGRAAESVHPRSLVVVATGHEEADGVNIYVLEDLGAAELITIGQSAYK